MGSSGIESVTNGGYFVMSGILGKSGFGDLLHCFKFLRMFGSPYQVVEA
jgi:hypothetical protein